MEPDPSKSDHFDGRRFFNPEGPQARGLLDVLRWKLTSRAAPWPKFVSDVEPSVPPRAAGSAEVRVTLVNHSTVLLQAVGSNILSDPIWSERASPFSFIGPRRHRAPGVEWPSMPRLHAILLTHNHYDHLDMPTLRRIMDEHQPMLIAPLRLIRGLPAGIRRNCSELDWWQACDIPTKTGQVRITSVPALHFSGRGLTDRNATLWCGYIVETPSGPVYFAGDTAFGSHFSMIRERFGPPVVALLPIGAYEPRWFMSAVHMRPEEAMQAHRILGAHKSVAIHHGTFQLADESIDAPEQELAACREGANQAGDFTVLRNR